MIDLFYENYLENLITTFLQIDSILLIAKSIFNLIVVNFAIK